MQRATLSDDVPGSPRSRTRKSFCRRLERGCCTTLAYFPLAFVYGLTTWAVWVEVNVSLLGLVAWFGYLKAALGVVLWALANICYTTAVFTGAGSPLDERRDASLSRARSGGGVVKGRGGGGGGGAYEGLPTYEDGDDGREGMTMVTGKSDGQPRYCKKCQCTKPDRTHHCSSCGQCVLKMDHHCPWLATCVGLRNYKPFLLFLTYTSLFCWVCFAVSANWVWAEIIDDVQMDQGLMVVHTILLAVLGGIIGLVLSGFTGWHIYLAATGQTTIESLEKTRYLTPLRKSLEHQPQRHYVDGDGDLEEGSRQEQSIGDQLKEIHANALPGVLRPEEGEDSRATTPAPVTHQTAFQNPAASTGSPARDSLHRSFASLEDQRERDRYAAYLDEQDSEKLPNAFDMGWRRNLMHVFGNQPLLWGLPVCNTSGDGWQWAVSPKWIAAREDIAQHRAMAKQREQAQWNGNGNGNGIGQPPTQPLPKRQEFLKWMPGQGFVDRNTSIRTAKASGLPASPPPNTSPSRRTANGRNLSRDHSAPSDLQLQPLDRRKGLGNGNDTSSGDSSSSDEEVKRMYGHVDVQGHGGGGLGDWNDVPEEFLRSPSRRKGSQRSRSRGRRKGD